MQAEMKVGGNTVVRRKNCCDTKCSVRRAPGVMLSLGRWRYGELQGCQGWP